MHSTRIHNPNLPIFAPFCSLYRDILAGGDVVDALAGIVLKREETTPFVSVAQHLFFNFLFSTIQLRRCFRRYLIMGHWRDIFSTNTDQMRHRLHVERRRRMHSEVPIPAGRYSLLTGATNWQFSLHTTLKKLPHRYRQKKSPRLRCA